MASRIALVTGASGDLGLAVVQTLLERDYEVVAQAYSRVATLDAFVKELSMGARAQCAVVHADLTEEGPTSELFSLVERRWGRLDCLINAVGGSGVRTLESLSLSEWERSFEINVTAPFLCIKYAVPLLARAKGCIVNLTSVAALTGGAFGPHYAAAKSALIGLTKSVAKELGAQQIRINAVAPGPVESAMTNSLPPAVMDRILGETALSRVVARQELAALVLFLCENGTGITGQTIVIDCGRHLH